MTQQEAMLVLGHYLVDRLMVAGLVDAAEEEMVQAVSVVIEVLVNNMMGKLTPETEEAA